MVGVSKAVKMPLRVMPSEAKAPYLVPYPIAVDAPTACDAVPIDRPCAIGLFILPTVRVLNPIKAPMIPVITTTAAVREGIPPTLCVTSIAIGVVTDLLASDSIMASGAPNTLATTTALTIPTRQPTSCDITMGNHSFFIASSCRYRGTPRATTAGFNQKSISSELCLYTSKGTFVNFRYIISVTIDIKIGLSSSHPMRTCMYLHKK